MVRDKLVMRLTNLEYVSKDLPFGYQTGDDSGVAFQIGNFDVRYYGIFFAIGFFVAVIIGILKLRFFYKVHYEPFFYFVFISVFATLLGARMWSYIIGNNVNWSQFFNFRSGGLAIEGGVIFTACVGIIWFAIFTRLSKYYVRVDDELGSAFVRKVSIWIYADAIIPLILFGQAIGRWGNFFNHEIYGDIIGTTLKTGPANIYGVGTISNVIIYDPGSSYRWLEVLMPGVYRGMFIYTSSDHVLALRVPLFLIESFFNIIFFALIYGIVDQIKGYHCGVNAGLYFVYYGTIRSFLETLRANPYRYDTSIVMSIMFVVLGIGIILFAQILSPRWRTKKIWYLVYVYLIYYWKCFGYLFVRSSTQTSRSFLKFYRKKRMSLGERKQFFFSKKDNLGYSVRPSFLRDSVDMYYYYDATSNGPFLSLVAKIFRKK